MSGSPAGYRDGAHEPPEGFTFVEADTLEREIGVMTGRLRADLPRFTESRSKRFLRRLADALIALNAASPAPDPSLPHAFLAEAYMPGRCVHCDLPSEAARHGSQGNGLAAALAERRPG